MDDKDTTLKVSGQDAPDTKEKKAKKPTAPKEMQFGNGEDMRAFAEGHAIGTLGKGRYFVQKDGQRFYCTIKKRK